ncbi:MAG: sugar phosphate nucleotidyltransferase [Acidobacteriota bacterium]
MIAKTARKTSNRVNAMVPWAIVPTAGKGKRLLPATAVIPKVLLPVGTRPMLHWAVEEAAAAGAQGLIVVVSPEQPQVRQYLELALRSAGKDSPLAPLAERLRGVELHFIEQQDAIGVGDALFRCRSLTAGDPFAVLLPDNWFDAEVPAIAQVAETFRTTNLNAIGLVEVGARQASLFANVGGVALEPLQGPAYRICSLQDKRGGAFHIEEKTSVLRGCARYVLDSSFYDALTSTGPPQQGEWDDVPAFQHLVTTTGLAGHLLKGRHFDVGQKAGYMAAAAYLAERASGTGASRR